VFLQMGRKGGGGEQKFVWGGWGGGLLSGMDKSSPRRLGEIMAQQEENGKTGAKIRGETRQKKSAHRKRGKRACGFLISRRRRGKRTSLSLRKDLIGGLLLAGGER